RRFAGTALECRTVFVMALAAQLSWQDRTEEGRALLAADCDIRESDFDDRAELRRRLSARLGGLNPDVGSCYLFAITRTWAELKGDSYGLIVLETYFQISAADYTPERLALLILDWEVLLDPNGRSVLFTAFLQSLLSCGRYVEARLLFEAKFGVTDKDYLS